MGERQEALAYYERVYLTYGRYAEQVAAAYWARGQVLESLGEDEAAREVYVELVGREDLASYPEYASARASLR